ncbi:MAG: methyltransferase domain-containing protein [Candidatus Eisenbacteria bacterium]
MNTRPGAVSAASFLLRFVDVSEQYGHHLVDEMVARLSSVELACDIGIGAGTDLEIVKKRFPGARLVGIDCVDTHRRLLRQNGCELEILDIERESLPLEDESVDLFIANQVLEHVKELFWVSHQICLKLRLGGHLIIGVPNICALHNRLTFLCGMQPCQMKSYSAHVRGFAPREIPRFLSVCFPGGLRLESFRGAQFYPFPKPIARVLARLFPSLAHVSFYLLKKVSPYSGEFLRHPAEARLETPFVLSESGPSAPHPTGAGAGREARHHRNPGAPQLHPGRQDPTRGLGGRPWTSGSAPRMEGPLPPATPSRP